jgi:hypothetical protein
MTTEIHWNLREKCRAFLGGRETTIEFRTLQELIDYLKRFIPDSSGFCGSYYQSDILEIKPVVVEV